MPAAWRRLGRLSQAFDASSPSTASNATPRAAWQDECTGKRALFRSPHGNLANPILSTSVRPFHLQEAWTLKWGAYAPSTPTATELPQQRLCLAARNLESRSTAAAFLPVPCGMWTNHNSSFTTPDFPGSAQRGVPDCDATGPMGPPRHRTVPVPALLRSLPCAMGGRESPAVGRQPGPGHCETRATAHCVHNNKSPKPAAHCQVDFVYPLRLDALAFESNRPRWHRPLCAE